MSIQLIAAAWRNGPRSPIERYTLIALADNASDEGFAFPSIENLAEKMQLDERTVRRKLQILERDGWIEVKRKARGGKGSTYRVVRARLGLPADNVRSADSVTGGRKRSADSVTADSSDSTDSVTGGSKRSVDSMTAESGDSADSATGDGARVTGLSVPTHRTFSPDSPDFQSKPPHPHKGRTVINRQEPSGEICSESDDWLRAQVTSPPFSQDSTEIPCGLSVLEYAAGVLEECDIVCTFQGKTQFGEAIRLLGKSEGLLLHEATKLMIVRVKAAQARGETISNFWIQDSKWKNNGGQHSAKGISRQQHRDAASIDAGTRAALSDG